jgi:hypothetical protein
MMLIGTHGVDKPPSQKTTCGHTKKVTADLLEGWGRKVL